MEGAVGCDAVAREFCLAVAQDHAGTAVPAAAHDLIRLEHQRGLFEQILDQIGVLVHFLIGDSAHAREHIAQVQADRNAVRLFHVISIRDALIALGD